MNDLLLTVASVGAAVAGIAAGVKGVAYLIQSGRFGFRKLQKAGVAITKLAAIGTEDAWPNGSHDLPTFLEWVYQTLRKILEFLGDDFRQWEAGVKKRPEGN